MTTRQAGSGAAERDAGQVKGQINDDRVTGRFEKVEAEPEVAEARVPGTGSFTVNGQVVYVDDSTVYEDRSAGVFSAITFTGLGTRRGRDSWREGRPGPRPRNTGGARDDGPWMR